MQQATYNIGCADGDSTFYAQVENQDNWEILDVNRVPVYTVVNGEVILNNMPEIECCPRESTDDCELPCNGQFLNCNYILPDKIGVPFFPDIFDVPVVYNITSFEINGIEQLSSPYVIDLLGQTFDVIQVNGINIHLNFINELNVFFDSINAPFVALPPNPDDGHIQRVFRLKYPACYDFKLDLNKEHDFVFNGGPMEYSYTNSGQVYQLRDGTVLNFNTNSSNQPYFYSVLDKCIETNECVDETPPNEEM